MGLSRREVLGTAVSAIGAAVVSSTAGEAQGQKPAGRARGRPTSRSATASTPAPSAATSSTSSASSSPPKAGFHAIEPWITEIDAYTPAAARSRISASGSPTRD